MQSTKGSLKNKICPSNFAQIRIKIYKYMYDAEQVWCSGHVT